MQQLSLLDLTPIPDEPEPESITQNPIPISQNPLPLTSAERHTLRWLNAKADYYLRLMNRFLDGSRCSQEVRSAELVRVYESREEVLVTIYDLENRHLCNKEQSMTTAACDATNQQAVSNKTQFMERSTAVTTA